MDQSISVIIPTLNEERHIGRLLDSLAPQLSKNDEIVVVDSFSKDRTRQIARKRRCRIVLVPARGIAAAKNAGARKAHGNILAFLDADSVVSRGWINKIKRHFSQGDSKAVAGMDLYTAKDGNSEKLYNAYSKLVFYIAVIYYRLGGKPWLPANNCAIQRSLFFDIGGYANVLCEDAELMRRWPRKAAVRYDSSMIVSLSDRRFEKYGFFRTVLLWIISDINAWRGAGSDARNYARI
ncbi:MAG: glycosyltransferase [Candidatus Micrarchaeota archaeon]|nr:glycosyltransferase [Candidatus Micrarchaeota archaeon]MDE1859852.1 glycosyltransferase [Candidatus Micrarchaeota archaeon]